MLLRLILNIVSPVMDMDGNRHSDTCSSDCALRYVCRCLRVTEDTLAQALATQDIQTLRDIRRHTGAGDGCMACHRRLKSFLDHHALPLRLTAAVA